MKLKEFLENVITTEIVVCIPPRIIAEKPELHNFVESLKNEYKINTAMKLSYTLEPWKNHIVAILTIDAHMYDVEALPLYSNQEALNVVLDLDVDKITTHLIRHVSFEIRFNHHHIMLLARPCHAPQKLSVIVVLTA